MEIQDEKRPNCPVCNSSKTRKDSVRKTLLCDKQRWFCKTCEKRWVNSPIRNIKGDPKTAVTVMDLYMKGVSYRSIADHLKQIYGLEVSQITVMNWVNTYLSRITQFVKSMQPQVGDYWLADEQVIKVKGNQQYVWNVLDNKTRFLLDSNASKTRSYDDARRTFKKAKKTAGKKAKIDQKADWKELLVKAMQESSARRTDKAIVNFIKSILHLTAHFPHKIAQKTSFIVLDLTGKLSKYNSMDILSYELYNRGLVRLNKWNTGLNYNFSNLFLETSSVEKCHSRLLCPLFKTSFLETGLETGFQNRIYHYWSHYRL